VVGFEFLLKFYFYFFGVVVCSLRIYTRSIYIVVEQGPGRGLMGDIFFY
jgi:hypothetical protein